MRKDLNMRCGKMIAQGSHSSMSFLTKLGEMRFEIDYGDTFENDFRESYFKNGSVDMHNYFDEIDHWLNNSFRKICVYVNSEEELIDIHRRALEAGLMSHLIEDNGTTEFNGVKTKTCVAIGPHYDERFTGITDHLPLL